MQDRMRQVEPCCSTYCDGRALVATIIQGHGRWGLQVDVAEALMAAGPNGVLILISTDVENTKYFDGTVLTSILTNLVPQSDGSYHLTLGCVG